MLSNQAPTLRSKTPILLADCFRLEATPSRGHRSGQTIITCHLSLISTACVHKEPISSGIASYVPGSDFGTSEQMRASIDSVIVKQRHTLVGSSDQEPSSQIRVPKPYLGHDNDWHMVASDFYWLLLNKAEAAEATVVRGRFVFVNTVVTRTFRCLWCS
ncbi:hypothetical protein LZ30DRAFT_259616 [Colletotrichum cereale]|nr:hypothetical protein LZ30DRAFT_259616 [Colletotrichum cereale]